jgi:hypothetical protein
VIDEPLCAYSRASWAFETRRGLINVDVEAKLSADDSYLLLRAAVTGMASRGSRVMSSCRASSAANS